MGIPDTDIPYNNTVYVRHVKQYESDDPLNFSNKNLTHIDFANSGKNPSLLLLSGNPLLNGNAVYRGLNRVNHHSNTSVVCVDMRGTKLDTKYMVRWVNGKCVMRITDDSYLVADSSVIPHTVGSKTVDEALKYFANAPWVNEFVPKGSDDLITAAKVAISVDKIAAEKAQAIKKRNHNLRRFANLLERHYYDDEQGMLSNTIRTAYEKTGEDMSEEAQVLIDAADQANNALEVFKESLIVTARERAKEQ